MNLKIADRIVVIVFTTLSLCSGCKNNEAPTQPPLVTPETVLFVSLEGGNSGFVVLRLSDLTKIDSLYYPLAAIPNTIEFSPDYNVWYSIKQEMLFQYQIFAVDSKTKRLLNLAETTGRFIVSDKDKEYLITFGFGSSGKTQFFKRTTLTLEREDSIGLIRQLVASPTEQVLYATYETYQELFRGIMVYNFQSFKPEKVIVLADSVRQRNMTVADLAISLDAAHLFVTVFNWNGFGGYGSFFDIDLATDTVVSEQICGAFAQIGMDSKHGFVYLSDPAGYEYEIAPSYQMLRYNIISKTTELFIDWRAFDADTLFQGSIITSDKMVVDSDEGVMFVNVGGNAITYDDKSVSLLKIDLEEKKPLAVFGFKPDSSGHITQRVVGLKKGNMIHCTNNN